MKILIVDDGDSAEITKEYLEEEGYEVEWVKSPEDCLKIIDQFNLLILDIMMIMKEDADYVQDSKTIPHEGGLFTGIHLLVHIREKMNLNGLIVFLLSARIENRVKEKLVGKGDYYQEYMRKPYLAEDVIIKLEKYK